VRQTTGYGTEVCIESRQGEALAEAVERDALLRSHHVREARLAFDARWSLALFLTAGGERVGYVQAEAARVFPVQPLHGPEWEEYQFGAVIDFPYASESPEYEAQCATLLDAAMRLLAERHPPTDVYCLIPEAASRQIGILETAGFRPQQRTSLETELLARHGFERTEDRIVIFESSTAEAGETDGPDPLRQLTRDPDDLRIFSNAQTKIRLQPTLEFWGVIQLYTTYSAYPFIPQFLEHLQEQFSIAAPDRLLVAPSAGGDFLRLWPIDTGAPSAAVAVDIRADLLRVAALRSEVPEIDLLNLVLCELLHRVILRDGDIEADVQADLERLCTTVHATRSAPGLLRFDHPASLALLARSFDEILQNRAIPDWFFPLKILASADPSTAQTNTARADALAHWLERRTPDIRRAVADLGALARDAQGVDVRQKYRRTGLGRTTRFIGADLTKDLTIPAGPFDLILCWEFIHVFHDRAGLGRFIDSMLDRLAPGGRLVITNIREAAAQRPPEQEWAREHLEATGVGFKDGFIKISTSTATGRVPFERRLHAHYPVLVVPRRNDT
jgi:hypothetical protein